VAEQTLGRVAGDFFASVLLAAEAGGALHIDASNLRSQLLQQLDVISRHPIAQAMESQELEDARFALVAWADEVLLANDWPGHDVWSQELLQQQIFRTNRGGDEFYERLARLRPDQNGARLIYYLCFEFGFEGQMVGDDARRQVVIDQHYDMLRAAGQAKDSISMGQLSPEAYDLEVHLEPPSSGTVARVLLRWSAAAALLFGLLYGILALAAARVPPPPGA
jgi:type IV/VI secretion system ImpK/VasF family protein